MGREEKGTEEKGTDLLLMVSQKSGLPRGYFDSFGEIFNNFNLISAKKILRFAR
jgi:hypothetical protein